MTDTILLVQYTCITYIAEPEPEPGITDRWQLKRKDEGTHNIWPYLSDEREVTYTNIYSYTCLSMVSMEISQCGGQLITAGMQYWQIQMFSMLKGDN